MNVIKVEYECDSTERSNLNSISLLSMEDFRGPLNFGIELRQPQQGKTSSFYSKVLGQVFIDMNKILMVHFQMDRALPNYFIRALPVYSAPEFYGVPVDRCKVHSVDSDPNGRAHSCGMCNCPKFDNVGHVIRAQSNEAQYIYDTDSERHSVLVPVKQFPPGSQSFAIGYYFACKTSCPQGMHRRPINIVFTLENHFGEVVGRRLLGVRICSCPKRDKVRLESFLVDKKPDIKLKKKLNTMCRKKNLQTGGNVKTQMNCDLRILKRIFTDFQDKIDEVQIFVNNL